MKVFIVVAHVVLITDAMRGQWLFPLWIDQAVPFFWMISAYLFARAADAHGSIRPADELRWARLWPRLWRVIVPYSVVYLGILALMAKRAALISSANALVGWEVVSGTGPAASICAVVVSYVCGSPGPGGYYIPCLFQMYLLLPFMWFGLKRWPRATVAVILVLTGVYELLAISGIVSPQAYRLTIVRYLPFLLLGMAFCRAAERDRLSLSNRRGLSAAIASLALGCAYIVGVSYYDFPALGVESWSTTNTFSALYSGAAFYLMLVASNAISQRQNRCIAEGGGRNVPNLVVEQLSRAALHVYVFQMLWYYFVNAHADAMSAIPLLLLIGIDVAACVGIGYMLYAIQLRITRRLG